MELTEVLIKFCRKSLGEPERIIVNSEAERPSPRSPREEWLDWRFQVAARESWKSWQKGLNIRLESFNIGAVRSKTFSELPPFAEFEPALRSIKQLADSGSIEALEALCQLAIRSARAIRTLQRKQYVREHPYPWQKWTETDREKATDAEVSKMLKQIKIDIPSAEQRSEENTQES